jgi:acyl carrier protein
MVKEQLKNIMASVFMTDISEIQDDISQLNFEKWESLQHLILIVNIESEFGVSFEPEEIVEMTSLSSVEQFLVKKLS